MILKESINEVAGYDEIPNDALNIHLGFQAAETFFLKYGRYPGATDSEKTTEDEIALSDIATQQLAALDGGEVTEELANILLEMCGLFAMLYCDDRADN